MTTKYLTRKTGAAPRVSRMRALKAGLALAISCLVASPAFADTMTYFPGGSVHDWTGNHGEEFRVVRTFNNGRSVTLINRHNGLGWVPFMTPPKPPLLRQIMGSLFDPGTGMTTTLVRGPRGSVRMEEEGNRLREHGDWMPRPTRSRISGALYDPMTNTTVSGVSGPRGAVRMIEQGNTLERHGDMQPHLPTSRFSGSAYDPDTNRTTTVVGRPGAYGRMVEEGNTLGRH